MNSSKVGFGYCGFDSSITAVIPKHEIIRSTEVNRIKKTHLLNWNSSQKIPTGKAAVIRPLPGNKKTLEQLKPKPFRARPVPRSHYNEPYRPELPSKKDRQPKIAPKKVDSAHPGLASRIWKNKMVDPILHRMNGPKVEDTGNAQEKPIEKWPLVSAIEILLAGLYIASCLVLLAGWLVCWSFSFSKTNY